MIDLGEIEREIQRLELEDTSYQNCTKLAVLYSIKDHNTKKKTYSGYSNSQSEFIQVCSGAPIDDLLSVLDEHMEAIKLIYPKEYTALINKIKDI